MDACAGAYPRNTEADGIRWAHLLIDGTVDTDYLQFVCGYGYSNTWQSAMLNELIRLARQGQDLFTVT